MAVRASGLWKPVCPAGQGSQVVLMASTRALETACSGVFQISSR